MKIVTFILPSENCRTIGTSLHWHSSVERLSEKHSWWTSAYEQRTSVPRDLTIFKNLLTMLVSDNTDNLYRCYLELMFLGYLSFHWTEICWLCWSCYLLWNQFQLHGDLLDQLLSYWEFSLSKFNFELIGNAEQHKNLNKGGGTSIWAISLV